MRIEIGWKRGTKDPQAAVFSDQRVAVTAADGTKLGFCGFACLDFHNAKLMVTYVDEDGNPLFQETWTRQDAGLAGSVRLLESSSEFEPYRPIEDLVK